MRTHSPETIEKIRAKIKAGYAAGRVPHNKGKRKCDYEPLTQVSLKMIGNKNPSGRFCKLNGMYGKKSPGTVASNKRRTGEKRSEECKRKIGANSKAAWKDPIKRKRWIKSLQKVWCKHQRMTYLEVKFENLCRSLNLPFRYVGNGKLWITSCGVHMNPDFVSTNGKRILIEVYAKCWKAEEYEELRGRLLQKAGFSTIFLSNDILDAEDWERQCLHRISLQIGS